MDKTKPENQIVCWHKQECSDDSNMDSDVCLPAHCISVFHSEITKSMQQILLVLQLNLFDKRDLMAPLKGRPN